VPSTWVVLAPAVVLEVELLPVAVAVVRLVLGRSGRRVRGSGRRLVR